MYGNGSVFSCIKQKTSRTAANINITRTRVLSHDAQGLLNHPVSVALIKYIAMRQADASQSML